MKQENQTEKNSNNNKEASEIDAENVNKECAQECKSGCDAAEQKAESAEIEQLQKKLEAAEAESVRNKDLYLRSVADLDNYRKKVQRQNEELAKFALQPLIEEMLPSIDHLDMAIDAAKKADDCKTLLQGVEMVRNQMVKVLQGFGVEEIKFTDNTFDPNVADCVARQPSDDIDENKIIKVVRSGYRYNGRLIRPASVIVSGGKAKE